MKKMKIPAIFAAFIIAASLCLTGCELLFGDSSQKYEQSQEQEQKQEQEEKVTYPQEHYVYYYLNGGYGNRSKYEEGGKASEYLRRYRKHTDSIILEEEPYRPGYVFEGWYSDKELTKKADSTFLETVTSFTVNLYAKWTLLRFDLSVYPYYNYYVMDEESRKKAELIETEVGDTITLPAVSEPKDGWHFKGWIITKEDFPSDLSKLAVTDAVTEVTVQLPEEKVYGIWEADEFYIDITGNARDYMLEPQRGTSFTTCTLKASYTTDRWDGWLESYVGDPGSKKREDLMAGLVITITDADGNEIPYTEREKTDGYRSFPCYDFIMPASDVTVTINFTTVKEDFKADTLIELPAGTDGTAGPTGKYVLFGYYPQSIKKDDVKVFEYATIQRGNMTYCLGSDGYYYCRTKRTGDKYKEDDGRYVEYKYHRDYWSKVEPIKWRVLDENYDHDLDRSTPGKRFLMAENSLFVARQLSMKHPEENELNNKREWDNNIYAYCFKDGEIKIAVDKTFKEAAFTEEGIGKICQTKMNTYKPMTGQVFIPSALEMWKYFDKDSDECIRSPTFYVQLMQGYDLNKRPDKGSKPSIAYYYHLREHQINEGIQHDIRYSMGYCWRWKDRADFWYGLHSEYCVVPVMCID